MRSQSKRTRRMTVVLSITVCLLGSFCLLNAYAAEAAKSLRVYFVGNSVTDNVKYDGLAKLAKSRKWTQVWGRHMIPGAPLSWIREHADTGFKSEPFGYFPKAFKEYQWDVVTLQPFDRKLDEDAKVIAGMIALMKDKSPDVQVYIYARWPRMSKDGKGYKYDKNDFEPSTPGEKPDYSKVDGYAKRWLAKYTDGWDLTNESRDYFEKLTATLNKQKLGLKKPLRIIPVGQVMYELDQRMHKGKVPGYSSIYAFYKDAIHLNRFGSYLVACTFFATIYRETPVGLPTDPYKTIDDATAKIIQTTVWDVVKAYPQAGIAPQKENADKEDAPATPKSAPAAAQ